MGLQINVTYDASLTDAPAGFQTAVQAAVAYLESVIATPITVNIQVSYGEIAGQTMEAGSLGESEPFGSWFSYAQVKNALTSVATSADDLASVATLGASDPTNGGQFFVNVAEQRALGLFPADNSQIDGYVGLSSGASYSFDPNNRAVAGDYDAIGILEHEITEVLGRVADVGLGQTNATDIYSPLDLFRYASAGVRDLTAAGDYFSVNGQTLLSQFNNAFQNGGDPGDWAASVPGDSFDAVAQPGTELSVSPTDLRELDVLGFHSTAPTPVPPIATPVPGGAAVGPVTFTQNFNIAQGQSYYFNPGSAATNTTGFTFSGTPTLTNAGTITLISTAGSGSVNIGVAGAQHGGAFDNGATGALYVEASASGAQVDGFQGGAGSPSVANAGLIQAVSAAGSATGVAIADAAAPFSNAVSGTVKVWAADTGIGADFGSGGAFSNAGQIDVTAANAIGEQGASSFTNSGVIDASDVNGGWGSVGADVNPAITSLTNTGTIQADYVVYYDTTASNGVSADIAIDNAGKMIGSLALANGDDTVTNTGSIVGNVYFGDGDSTYAGASGTLSGGAIYLGYGTNNVTLGNDGETVFGGFGSDTITGGSGNDVIEIGRGNNTIDGGGGFNVLSFADSATGVTANLATGTATDAGTDTIKNIQEVIGSNYNNILTAGPGGSILIAGAGHDTLTGGAGNDTLVAGAGGDSMQGGGGDNTFIYSAGDEYLFIQDFNTNDVLKIYGYSAAQSVQQEGLSTIITLPSGFTIDLDGVTPAELNSTDVIYSAGAWPGLALPSSPPPFGTNPVFIEQNMTIQSGETINEVGQPYGLVNEGHSLDEFGDVNVSYPVVALTDNVYGWIDNNIDARGNTIASANDTVTLEAPAQFIISDLEGGAVGFAPLYTTALTDNGQILISAGGDGYGVQTTTAAAFSFTEGQSGALQVNAQGAAYGLALATGAPVVTQGAVQIQGVTTAYGVKMDQAQGQSISNSEVFSVSASAGPAYGIAVGGLTTATTGSPFVIITNSGTLTAQTAISEFSDGSSPSQVPLLKITNSGRINGNLDLASSEALLVNTGMIFGNILLHDDSVFSSVTPGDTINLSAGSFTGYVAIRPGAAGNVAVHDVIETGSATTQIKVAAGESNLTAAVTGVVGGHTTVTLDIASTQGSDFQNVDGGWVVKAGTDGTLTLTDVQTLQFTDKPISLSTAGPAPHDFNADGKSDFLIQNTGGTVTVGENVGGQAGYTNVSSLGPEWSFHGTGDFLGDGRADFLIENAAGAVDVGEVVGGQTSYTQVSSLGSEWSFHETGDFLGDGRSDFLIENTAGAVVVGEVVNGQAAYTDVAGLGPEWKFVGAGHFLGDGHDQFLIESTAGAVMVANVVSGQASYTQVASLGSEWTFEGAGAFLGDGKSDFLIENTLGQVYVGEVGSNNQAAYTQIAALGSEWKFVGTGDYLGEGHDQFLIENTLGQVDIGDFTAGQIRYTQVAGLGAEWAFH